MCSISAKKYNILRVFISLTATSNIYGKQLVIITITKFSKTLLFLYLKLKKKKKNDKIISRSRVMVVRRFIMFNKIIKYIFLLLIVN